MMCASGAANADADDGYLYDSGSLSTAQIMGDACAVCHVKWPRPRHPIGLLADGGEVYGCDDCAGIAASHAARTLEHALVAH
jgi:hypothetical protein